MNTSFSMLLKIKTYRQREAMKIRIRPIDYLKINDNQKKKMALVLDPVKDGNCGFRCISHAIYGDESMPMRVKKDMYDWYTDNQDGIYKGNVKLFL